MKQSTQNILMLAGGAALLYVLAKKASANCPTTICPTTGAVHTGSATNPNMGGNNFGVCPNGGWC